MKVTFSYESSHDAYTLSWDQPERSTDRNNIYYKVLVDGKHVHPARQIKDRHYKFIPEDMDATEYTFSVIACDMNGFESEKGEEVTCNKERGTYYIECNNRSYMCSHMQNVFLQGFDFVIYNVNYIYVLYFTVTM